MPVIEHERLGESIDAKFCRVISSTAAERVLRRKAGDVDDETAARVTKSCHCFTCAIERTVQVQVDIAMPVFGRHLANLFEHCSPGVVHKNVQPPEFPVDRFKEPAHFTRLRDVGAHPENPAQRAQFAHRPVGGFLCAPAQRH